MPEHIKFLHGFCHSVHMLANLRPPTLAAAGFDIIKTGPRAKATSKQAAPSKRKEGWPGQPRRGLRARAHNNNALRTTPPSLNMFLYISDAPARPKNLLSRELDVHNIATNPRLHTGRR